MTIIQILGIITVVIGIISAVYGFCDTFEIIASDYDDIKLNGYVLLLIGICFIPIGIGIYYM